MDFIAKNWVNMCLVLVGSFALVIYILQERRKKIDAASLIVLQIDEIRVKLRKISNYIVEGKLNETAFYESLPLMGENYWNKYKHYFVRDMDAMSYSALNQLYNYVSEVQEQQLLMQSLQKNGFYLTQSILANMEAQLINNGLNNSYGNITPSQIITTIENMFPPNMVEEDKNNLHNILKRMIEQNPNMDSNQFWSMYWQQDGRIKEIINKGALTLYTPIQIQISLEKILKEYSMLEIVGTEGYQMLKKFSKKKF